MDYYWINVRCTNALYKSETLYMLLNTPFRNLFRLVLIVLSNIYYFLFIRWLYMSYYRSVENPEILKNIIVDFDIPEQWKIFDCVFTFSVCYKQTTEENPKLKHNIVLSYNLGLLNVNNGVYSEIIIKRENSEPRLCIKELLSIVIDFLKTSGNLKYNSRNCLHFLQICRKGDIEWSLLGDRDYIDLRITQGMPYYKYTALHHYTNTFKVNKCISVPHFLYRLHPAFLYHFS